MLPAFMRVRARRCDELGQDPAIKRAWQQRALSLNPSATGLHDYFSETRTFDSQEFEFLSGFVADEQTEPRIGLQAMLKAFDLGHDTDNDSQWFELLAFTYRRSPTYDADHQRALEILVQHNQTTSQLPYSGIAAEESYTFIHRNLYLDSGDHLMGSNPKEAARCYYKAFETKDDDRVILGKLLDAYQAAQDWAKSTKVLRKLASLEGDSSLQAKYLYAMGLIQRDKLNDHYLAVRTFDKALDMDPTLVKAIQASMRSSPTIRT